MIKTYPITLDCIIFGLQRFGGISNYWAKLVDSVSGDPTLECNLILPNGTTYVDFNDEWTQRIPFKREVLDPQIARYLPVNTDGGGGVFHTPYYRLPRKKNKKYVVTVHDFTYERYRTGLARFVHSRQKLASILRADAVLCVSESTRRDVIEFCPGVETEKLHVIHLGVDGETFYQESAGPSNANEQTVLFVGQRGGYKRFDLAVEAVRQSPRLYLGIVGPKLTYAERALLLAQLGNRWQEFGPVSTSDLRRLYSSAFAFIFPSDYEGFGLPILEAMACGCPVVAAALSSLPEVGGNAAHYAASQTGESYASALSTLNFGAVREDAIRRGIERVAQFDWFQTLQKTKAVYIDQ
jgi:mannosyltransferase